MSSENEFYFNLPKLSEEVDVLFEKKLLQTEQVLDTTFRKGVEGHRAFCSEFTTQFEKEYRETISKVLSEAKDELINEISKGRTILNISDNVTMNIEESAHHQFEEVFRKLITHKKVMLVGKAGTGKTYMASQIAEKLGLNFYKYSCSRDSSVHDLMGYKQPRSEEYLETPFLKAYEEGGVFLCDEFDAMDGSMSLFFNGVADNSDSISIPHRDSKPIAKKHKDFYLIMCGNTWGGGSIEYQGRDFQDKALLDRFRVSKLEIGYHTKLEKSLCFLLNTSSKLDGTTCKESTNFYQIFHMFRYKLEEIGSYLSTRNIEDLVISILSEEVISKNTLKKVFTSFIVDFSDNEKDKLKTEIIKILD